MNSTVVNKKAMNSIRFFIFSDHSSNYMLHVWLGCRVRAHNNGTLQMPVNSQTARWSTLEHMYQLPRASLSKADAYNEVSDINDLELFELHDQ